MKKILLGVLGAASTLLLFDAYAQKELLGGQGYKDITNQVIFSPSFVGIHLFRDNPMAGGYVSLMGEKVADFTFQEKGGFGTTDKVKIGTLRSQTPGGLKILGIPGGTNVVQRDLFVSIADFANGAAKILKDYEGMHVVMGPGPVITGHSFVGPDGTPAETHTESTSVIAE